jgi:hypothetical protein
MEKGQIKLNWHAFPIALLCVVAYLLMGFLGKLWHPGWLVFFAIPLYHWGVDCVIHRRMRGLPTFIVATVCFAVYLGLGFGLKLWHPTWVMFFAIPIVASLESFFNGGIKGQIKRKVDSAKEEIKDGFRQAGEDIFHSDDKID